MMEHIGIVWVTAALMVLCLPHVYLCHELIKLITRGKEVPC